MPQAIHFISVGGSAMHNLALALQHQGYIITGSDNQIYEPSRTRLKQHSLLPDELGWFPEKITTDLDGIIVGMHAHKDNPELIKALELGLPIYSYPEFIYQQSQQKQRVVIAGSHGKTTITAMILHVMAYHKRLFDYWIGDEIDGFDATVKLTPDAPVIIIEGDEYASSPIDARPKFLHYQPHIALISGIAWDHINIYPTWDQYVDQFESLAEAMPKAGILIFDESDDMLDVIGQKDRPDITKIPYVAHPSEIVNGQTYLITKQGHKLPLQIFGDHNMKNVSGALTVCNRIGVTEDQFYEAITSFKGVAQRLEKVAENGLRILYRDFAHSPAKVEATTEAVKRQYLDRKLLAVLELYTLSSLNKVFLDQYRGTLEAADEAVVYFDAKTIQNMSISVEDIAEAFDKPNLQILTNTEDLTAYLLQKRNSDQVFLLMSSGTFSGLNLNEVSKELIQ
ncbi:UDP-N-acetylmuramate--L-alanine ligase [Spirosoma endophyticum]|uniref:UDP-N-acetylmuramate: L-alanyl-gamma-D-glutamyl-meso-diaminopimelate ligase n=1 Tax=Spirosoma endophyticum TaxID=662367 RepID=A0A1I2HH88_9BACT|nr:Mur ligase family protein [Spirosoma endophyticum]SFF27841.1 UDP-N-acetylmuramate: L-alanyl-gamma-D-glutamyl-meso-diaminopimelate ligase [Spirosoma endophyticum]